MVETGPLPRPRSHRVAALGRPSDRRLERSAIDDWSRPEVGPAQFSLSAAEFYCSSAMHLARASRLGRVRDSGKVASG